MSSKKKIIVVGTILLLILGALIFRYPYDSSGSRIDSLDNFNNGIIFYYDKSTPQVAKRVITELADELNVDLLSLDISKDKKIIAHYLDQNNELINEYNKIKNLELALKELKNLQDNKVDEINFYYNRALNLVKEGVKDDNLELQDLKRTILEFSTIQASELDQLLQLQQRPRIRVPLYSEVNNDLDNIPLLKFIYNGNVRRSISLKSELYEDEKGQLSKEEFKEYLVQEWFNNYSDSNDGKIFKEKLENKENFVLLVIGNSCPHCKKLIPIINNYSNYNYNIAKINIYNIENSDIFNQLVKSGEYGLEQIRWYPTILAFYQGKQVDEINVHDIDIYDAGAELGYAINENLVDQFLKKYAQN